MQKIRITGVPEHFNYPWLQVIEQQPFLDEGIELVWQEESRGSGAMNRALRDGSTDIALVLTESFIKDRIEGNPSRIIGFHIASPLIWGIHISARSPQSSLTELEDIPFLISRYGSGSHLMAFLLAQREGWASDKLKFEVIDNLDGAKKAFENPEPKMFLWEKYTTKPLVDAGQFKRVGEIPTPWPCFVIVVTEQILETHTEVLVRLRDMVYAFAAKMTQDKDFPATISKTYGIKEEDIKAWLKQTRWETKNIIEAENLVNTIKILRGLNLIKAEVTFLDLIDDRIIEIK
ncbi:hypothetical protein Belba_3348 [Belliella baltica DSM 15883]|uniref:Ca3427-like PBP 2 domain-containing protein n=1 Tax=Belliella baltica (strain DSM 15883 / CIP 108006 / LMG 21964 / BA134) TaxID=866536 RepID=I3Z9D4_BELBD|nr:substrate-binding domain-containing protein [Belliella baltica]AFL85852.1 hypothetical protein Belba_3348 [Belliella baltica DSM 15883]